MDITVVNYALPEPTAAGIGWWYKPGSHWPATILDRAKAAVTEYNLL